MQEKFCQLLARITLSIFVWGKYVHAVQDRCSLSLRQIIVSTRDTNVVFIGLQDKASISHQVGTFENPSYILTLFQCPLDRDHKVYSVQLRTTESSISTKLFNKAINRIYGAHLVKFIALRHLVESRSTISARQLYITCLCLVDKHNISPERALNSEYRSISIVIPSLNVPKPTRSRLSGSDQSRSIHLAT